MVRARKMLFQAAWFCLLVGCISPVEIELDNTTGTLAIFGQVSTQERRNYVTIGTTAGLGRIPFPIQAASVEVVDQHGVVTEFDSMEQPGVYVRHGFTAVPGNSYQLRITLPSGETIESTPDRVPEEVGTHSAFFEIEDEELTDNDGKVSTLTWVNVKTIPQPSQPGNLLFLRWSVDEIYIIHPTDFPDIAGAIPPPCYITQPVEPQRITLRNESNEVLSPILIGKRQVDKSFYIRHYFLAYQSSLSPEAYEYWRKVYVLATQVGTIFDVPGAPLPGNLHYATIVGGGQKKVLGYFNAVNESMDKFFLTQGDLPRPLEIYCDYNYNRSYFDYSRECLDCLLAPNSSYNRPDEWN